MKVNKELMKGSTTMLVLSVLEKQEMYGYQIIKELERRSEDVFSMNEGTLYPILHAMEKEAYLEAYWEQSESARKRKYYRITQQGRKMLQKQKEEWKVYACAVGKVIEAF
ncbi:MAG: PadR family transcriptional regulator [Lachnospiraceae bacterium]|nr:PadR family transcriptional regulator [Lachnospiraceae bacterium]